MVFREFGPHRIDLPEFAPHPVLWAVAVAQRALVGNLYGPAQRITGRG